MQGYERNKKIFLIYTLLTGKMFVGTTQVLFLTFKGFSFVEIMLISTITGLVSLILEIPSGMMADKVGYKKCISAGLLISVIGYIVILFSSSFAYIVGYSVLMAIGMSILSGTDYSLLYESFIALKQEDKFKEYIRKVNSIKMYVVAVLTIMSGILYKINEYIPFLLTTALYFAAFIVSFFFIDVKSSEEDKVKLKDYFFISLDFIKSNKRFRLFIIEGACFTVLFMNQNILLQQYLSDIGVEVSLFGVIFFAFNIISAFVSKRGGYFEKKFGRNTKIIFTLLIIVCFITAGFFANLLGIVFLAMCRVSIATINPILDTQVNECIESNNRATLLSVYNALSSIADSACSPVLGIGIDRYGVFYTYIIFGVTFLVFLMFLIWEKKMTVLVQ